MSITLLPAVVKQQAQDLGLYYSPALSKIMEDTGFRSAKELVAMIEDADDAGVPMSGHMVDNEWFARFTSNEPLGPRSVSATFLPGGAQFDLKKFRSETLDKIVEFYSDHNVDTLIRTSPLTPGLGHYLSNHGFEIARSSHVVVVPIEWASKKIDPAVVIFDDVGPEWFSSFVKIGEHEKTIDTYREIFFRLGGKQAHMLLMEGDTPVSCGSALMFKQAVGLYNGATLREKRGRGFAPRLSKSRLKWGKEQGAVFAHAQVFSGNPSGIRALEKLGFTKLYSYMQYRKPLRPESSVVSLDAFRKKGSTNPQIK